MPHIQMKTSIPGPKAQALLRRKEQFVARGPFNTVLSFAEHGEGALLTDIDGNTFLDFAGAIGTLNVGHRPTRVVQAVKNQLDKYIHTCFNVMMYEPYVALAEELARITPGNHAKKAFFANSGAEAVENAIKIARKYTGRKGIISFERGYHGRTLLTMSLTSKVKPYKYQFGPFAPETFRVGHPYYYRKPEGMTDEQFDRELLQQLETFFLSEAPADEIAAVIIEPVQGEGGFIVPSVTFMQGLKRICEKYGILFIADEIQTGFARTGSMFAIEQFGVVPDLMTLSKSLGAGLPIAAVVGRSEIMDAPGPGEIGGTYGGSPLGCVAAIEVIKMIEEEGLVERSQQIGQVLTTRFRSWQQRFEQIGDVRGLGSMVALEFVKDRISKEPDKELTAKIIAAAQQKGLILLNAGLYGNCIRILVPLVITDEQLEEGLDVLESVLTELLSQPAKIEN
ncbi:4-aminobutyrate--2-oxoglutarate transaminase [Anoxybacteroides amylolyticum]|uniref:(S)-3-amino-2-methylpropionate transaminase n=1 Tax=Anoxybacteroides amylolyticum TaxID=294699 RepID=A0A160F4S7_9BACL|nr:4-aminobutyrate--2-oxoglutarate transaminase [Anoxybacillus amylolyticus]ANB60795.1 4-aminobutyrate transaminase [Anoxybacillus amylolyticus]